MVDMKKEWSGRQFMMREVNFLHAPYEPEFAFYVAVRSGNVEKVNHLCKNDFIDNEGLGKLSDNPLHNAVYHFIITTALVARFCIDGGMEHEVAYGLSDFYIQKADKCGTPEQISQLHGAMSIDYAQRMAALKKEGIFSKPVAKCMDYIYGNLHTRITLAMLAEYVNLNPNYLSRLFKKETGISISLYIQRKKIEAAQNMLGFMDDSVAQIASTLSFPTQSYFIEVFKKQVGMTPKKYREFCFRKIAVHDRE